MAARNENTRERFLEVDTLA